MRSPKISYTNLSSSKMAYANSADLDQTASAIWSESTLFVFPPNILYDKCIKNKI